MAGAAATVGARTLGDRVVTRQTAQDKAVKYALRDLPTLDKAVALASGRTAAVQAGGNLGVWPDWLSRVFATVYTFEPAPDLFPILTAQACAPNVIKFQAALGCERTLIATSADRDDGKNSHPGVTHVSGPGTVPTLRIDDLGLQVCDLIALDLEGYELFALRGAVETVHRCRPVILVEINGRCERFGVMADQVRGWLASACYRLVFREHSDEVYVPVERAA